MTTTTDTNDQSTKKTSPILMAAPMTLVLALVLWGDALEAPQSSIEAPPLYSPVAHCSRGGDPAFYAQSASNRARIKMARYPFYPADGPRALTLLSEAERCFSASGSSEDAARVTSTRKAFEARVDADYRGHRLRLAQALERDRADDAHRETQQLLSLLDDQRKHAYVRWLNRILRRNP